MTQENTNENSSGATDAEQSKDRSGKIDLEYSAKYVDIFVWAFELPCAFNAKSLEDFLKLLSDRGWKDRKLSYESEPAYSMLQYFNGSTRQIYSIEGDKCRLFKYFDNDDEYVKRGWKYYVKKGDRSFEWQILDVGLEIYPSGVGLLSIEACSETQCGDKSDQAVKDELLFNDYARRISMPYIVGDTNDTGAAPAEVGIHFEGYNLHGVDYKRRCVRSFTEEINEYLASDNKESLGSKLAAPARFLKELVAHSIGEKTSAVDVVEKEKKINGFSDDRMFLIALYRDDKRSELLKNGGYRPNGENEEFIKWLYALIFVDNKPNEPTCQDSQMRADILQKVVYPRWADYGTIHAATNYSVICLCNEDSGAKSTVVKPFLYHYAYMTRLVYAQRLSLQLFERRAKELVLKRDEMDTIEETLDFHRDYVGFDASFMLTELSPQDQGIDFYQLLQNALLVNQEKKTLDHTLEALRDVAKARSDKIAQEARDDAEEARQNFQSHLETVAILLGVVAGFVPILFQTMPKPIEWFSEEFPWLYLGLWLALPALLYLRIYKKFRNYKR